MIRVGIGYDIHPLVAGRNLVLGGVEIPFEKGLQGHSDADALLHAVIDALLGAASLGDIGHHFPPGDPRYRGMSSLKLLQEGWALVNGQGWRISNIDSVVVAERPKVAPYLDEMKRRMGAVLGASPDQIGIKATTAEGLGALGRAEGIAAYAVALLERSDR